MKVGIMQPYFFPYIGYWQLINTVDHFVLYDDVNYIKRGWINRNQILINGQSHFINLKLQNASQNKLINNIEILGDYEYNHKKIISSIEINYKKAPYYTEVVKLLEDIIDHKEKNLAKYLEYGIKCICNYLSIRTEILVSSEISKDNTLKGQDKILEICRKIGCSTYINPIGGQTLYSRESFRNEGMELLFIKSGEITYKQFHHTFVPNLSIIDVMMFNSKEKISEMLKRYELI